MQNYQFTIGGDFFSLISKNYYRVIFTWISWILNLFHNLTNIYTWNNSILPKAINLQKLVTEGMNLKIRMQEHREKACDSGYPVKPFYATIDGRNGGGGWKSHDHQRKASEACSLGYSGGGWLKRSNLRLKMVKNYTCINGGVVVCCVGGLDGSPCHEWMTERQTTLNQG